MPSFFGKTVFPKIYLYIVCIVKLRFILDSFFHACTQMTDINRTIMTLMQSTVATEDILPHEGEEVVHGGIHTLLHPGHC